MRRKSTVTDRQFQQRFKSGIDIKKAEEINQGEISQDVAADAKGLKAYDRNNDGKVTLSELDLNNDGKLTGRELRAAFVLLDSFDKNGSSRSVALKGKAGKTYHAYAASRSGSQRALKKKLARLSHFIKSQVQEVEKNYDHEVSQLTPQIDSLKRKIKMLKAEYLNAVKNKEAMTGEAVENLLKHIVGDTLFELFQKIDTKGELSLQMLMDVFLGKITPDQLLGQLKDDKLKEAITGIFKKGGVQRAGMLVNTLIGLGSVVRTMCKHITSEAKIGNIRQAYDQALSQLTELEQKVDHDIRMKCYDQLEQKLAPLRRELKQSKEFSKDFNKLKGTRHQTMLFLSGYKRVDLGTTTPDWCDLMMVYAESLNPPKPTTPKAKTPKP